MSRIGSVQLHFALDAIHHVMEAKVKHPTASEELLYVIAEALVELLAYSEDDHGQ
jgi:hypothetical protein